MARCCCRLTSPISAFNEIDFDPQVAPLFRPLRFLNSGLETRLLNPINRHTPFPSSSSPLLTFHLLPTSRRPFSTQTLLFAMAYHQGNSSSWSMPPPPRPSDTSSLSTMRERAKALDKIKHPTDSTPKIVESIHKQLEDIDEEGWAIMSGKTDKKGIIWTRRLTQELLDVQKDVSSIYSLKDTQLIMEISNTELETLRSQRHGRRVSCSFPLQTILTIRNLSLSESRRFSSGTALISASSTSRSSSNECRSRVLQKWNA